MHGSMSGVGKRGLLATAPNLDSTEVDEQANFKALSGGGEEKQLGGLREGGGASTGRFPEKFFPRTASGPGLGAPIHRLPMEEKEGRFNQAGPQVLQQPGQQVAVGNLPGFHTLAIQTFRPQLFASSCHD
jgi:hypothetical protein